MKAVNLIPVEERRGPSAGGRSGVGAYAVLGVLAVLVLMAAVWTLTGKTVNDRKAQLADVEQQATAAESQAAQLSAYSAFSDLRKKRADTVASIANSRFDWAHVMHEIARVIPPDTHLVSLSGTVSPSADAPSGGGEALALRGSNTGPAIDIVGCANGQANVSRMMSRLRLVDGVTHVTLAESSKNDQPTGGASATAGGNSDDCRYNDAIAKFDVLILFNAPPAAAAPAAAGTTAPAGTAAPVSSTTTTATTPTGSTP